jgi:transcription elongation factor Elf1
MLETIFCPKCGAIMSGTVDKTTGTVWVTCLSCEEDSEIEPFKL